MSTTDRPPELADIEARLRAALTARAEQVQPEDLAQLATVVPLRPRWGLKDTGLREAPGGVGEESARVQEPAASSSAVCAPTSASITASRSPSTTWSRL